jgi:hypothetical protein
MESDWRTRWGDARDLHLASRARPGRVKTPFLDDMLFTGGSLCLEDPLHPGSGHSSETRLRNPPVIAAAVGLRRRFESCQACFSFIDPRSAMLRDCAGTRG